MTLEEQIDLVYDTLDDLFLAGKFDEAELVMRETADAEPPLGVLLSLLTISSCVPPEHTGIHCARTEIAATARRQASNEAHADAMLWGLM